MPRVARNKVEFEVEGKSFEAQFSHYHSGHGVDVRTVGREGSIKVKHLTICVLSEKGSPKAALGEAACSLKDTYNWRYGIKLSLERALEVIGVSRETERGLYGKFLQSFYREMANRSGKEQHSAGKEAAA